uniref:Uncharacterized protein n=1 Tax=viral metagenome TaxID=1070528 RepID=A0A6C0AJY6_9ZZZZ
MVRRSLKRGGLVPTSREPTLEDAVTKLVGTTKNLGELLNQPWSVPESGSDKNFEELQSFVLGKLPADHQTAVQTLIDEIKQLGATPVGGHRKTRGGVNYDSKFYAKCAFFALIEVISDGLAVTPQLVFAGSASAAVIIAAVGTHLGAVGAAGAGAATMGLIMNLYRTLTKKNSLTIEAAAAAEAEVAADEGGGPVEFVPLNPPLEVGGITQAMGWIEDKANADAAYAAEDEPQPAGVAEIKPLHAWINQLQSKPGIAAAFKPDAEEPFDVGSAVSKTFLVVFSVFYLVKLAKVIKREALHEAQLAAIADPPAPAPAPAPAPMAAIVAMAADVAPGAAPNQLAAVPAAPAAAAPARARRRMSRVAAAAARLAAAAAADLAGYEGGGSEAEGGRRRRTRRHRHRRHLSVPTRKRRSSSGRIRGGSR